MKKAVPEPEPVPEKFWNFPSLGQSCPFSQPY